MAQEDGQLHPTVHMRGDIALLESSNKMPTVDHLIRNGHALPVRNTSVVDPFNSLSKE